MKVTIHQPSYWPWLGLLDKIAKIETYIILDDVAANKASYQYRNIFFCNGRSQFITLPVDYKMGVKINELKFKNHSWVQDHLNKLYNYYCKAPYFDDLFDELKNLYLNKSENTPIDFIIDTMKFSFSFLDINVECVKSSELNSELEKGDLVLDLCTKIEAKTYLSGQGANNYMTDEQIFEFEKRGIYLKWHNFNYPTYPQHKKLNFISGLACLDLFFWNGKENSRELFWENVGK
jgi:hypothetical protein